MTLCNMAIEAGARAGMVAVDDKTDRLPARAAVRADGATHWDRAVAHWRTLTSDEGAKFDTVVALDASALAPQVTWGTSPEMVVPIDGRVPDPDQEKDPARREGIERALAYMGLAPNTPMTDIAHRQGVHRLVHQLADRGPARRGGGRARPPRGGQR